MLTARNAFLLPAGFACQLISLATRSFYSECWAHFRPFNLQLRKPLFVLGLAGFINFSWSLVWKKKSILLRKKQTHTINELPRNKLLTTERAYSFFGRRDACALALKRILLTTLWSRRNKHYFITGRSTSWLPLRNHLCSPAPEEHGWADGKPWQLLMSGQRMLILVVTARFMSIVQANLRKPSPPVDQEE